MDAIFMLVIIKITIISIEMDPFHIQGKGKEVLHALKSVEELKEFLSIIQTQNMGIM